MPDFTRPPNPNPLNEIEHLPVLNQAIEACAWQDDILQRCIHAGIPVDKWVNEHARSAAVASGIKRLFFPHAQ